MCEIVNQHTGNHELAINRPECGSEEYVSMKETDSVFSFLSEVPGASVSIIVTNCMNKGSKIKGNQTIMAQNEIKMAGQGVK